MRNRIPFDCRGQFRRAAPADGLPLPRLPHDLVADRDRPRVSRSRRTASLDVIADASGLYPTNRMMR
jgi:hypothetical protein